MTRDELRRELAGMVATATDGEVGAGPAQTGDAPLTVLGVTSLGLLRLVDAVEERYGVALDPGDAGLESLDGLADRVAARGSGAG